MISEHSSRHTTDSPLLNYKLQQNEQHLGYGFDAMREAVQRIPGVECCKGKYSPRYKRHRRTRDRHTQFLLEFDSRAASASRHAKLPSSAPLIVATCWAINAVVPSTPGAAPIASVDAESAASTGGIATAPLAVHGVIATALAAAAAAASDAVLSASAGVVAAAPLAVDGVVARAQPAAPGAVLQAILATATAFVAAPSEPVHWVVPLT